MAMEATVSSDAKIMEAFLNKLLRMIEIEASRDPLKECARKLLNRFESDGGLSCRTVPPHLKEAFEEMLTENRIPFMGTKDSAGNYIVFLPASAANKGDPINELINRFCMHYAEYYMQHTNDTFLNMVKADGDKSVKCYTFKTEEERAIFVNKCYDDGNGFVVTTIDDENGYSVILRQGEKENKALASHILTMEEMSVARKLAVRHDGRQLGSAMEAFKKNKSFALYDARNHTTSTYVQYKDGIITVNKYNSVSGKYAPYQEDLRGKSAEEVTGYLRHLMAEIPNCRFGDESEFAAYIAKSEETLASEFTEAQYKLYEQISSYRKSGLIKDLDGLEKAIAASGLAGIRPGYNVDTLEYIRDRLVSENKQSIAQHEVLENAHIEALKASERSFTNQLSYFSELFLKKDISKGEKDFTNFTEKYKELVNVISPQIKAKIFTSLGSQIQDIARENNIPFSASGNSARTILKAVAESDELWKDAPFDGKMRDAMENFAKMSDIEIANLSDEDKTSLMGVYSIAVLKGTQDKYPNNKELLSSLSAYWECESAFVNNYAKTYEELSKVHAEMAEINTKAKDISALNKVIRNERNDHARIKPLVAEFDRIDAAYPDYDTETRYKMKMDILTGKTPLSDEGKRAYKDAMKEEFVATYLKERQQEYVDNGLTYDVAKEEAIKSLTIEFEQEYEQGTLADDFSPFKGIDKSNIDDVAFEQISITEFEEKLNEINKPERSKDKGAERPDPEPDRVLD